MICIYMNHDLFFKKVCISLCLAVLGLYCCLWAFSSCDQRGLLSRCGVRASHCCGFPCCRHRLQSTQASALMAHRLSCLRACGIFPEQVSNPWQANSYPLDHQGSAHDLFLNALPSLCHLQKQAFI